MKTTRLILPVALAAALSLSSCETILRALDTDTTSNTGPYAIPLDQARQQALFLSDKMAYELNLSDEQYAAVYEINLDYLLQQNGESTILGTAWTRRNSDLYYVLSAAQYDYYRQYDYFYQPLYWSNRAYAYRIYSRYYDSNTYYYSRPSVYATYRGGHNRGTTSYYNGRFGYRSSYSQPPAYGQPGYSQPSYGQPGYNQNRSQGISNFGQQQPNDHGQSLKDMWNNAGKQTNTNSNTSTFGSQQRRNNTSTGTSTGSNNSGTTNNKPSQPTAERSPNPRQGNTSTNTSTFQPITGRQNNNNNTTKSVNTSRQQTTTVNPNATQKTTPATQQSTASGSFGGHR